jgi:hypothetical protein
VPAAVAKAEHVAELVRRDPDRQRPRRAAQARAQQHLVAPLCGAPDRRAVAEAVAAAAALQIEVVDPHDDVGLPQAADQLEVHVGARAVPARRGGGDRLRQTALVVHAHDPVRPYGRAGARQLSEQAEQRQRQQQGAEQQQHLAAP